MAGFDYSGHHAYHITVVARARESILLGSAPTIAEALAATASATQFDLLAYSIMPDHLHALVAGNTDDSNLIRFVQRFKQRTSFDYKREMNMRLWQPSFYDHALRSEEDLLVVARYIVGNPVRAGLAETPDDWPHSGGSLIVRPET